MSAGIAERLRITFGERVRERRQALGWTQAELAGRLAMHQPDLCDIEHGRHSATLTTVARIAKALRLPATSLLG